MDSGTHHDECDTEPSGGDRGGATADDEHDEVFEMSSDESFLQDSGIQTSTISPSQATPGKW